MVNCGLIGGRSPSRYKSSQNELCGIFIQGVEKSEDEESEVESETGEAEEGMEKQSSSEEEPVDEQMDNVEIKREMKAEVTPKTGEQDSVMVIAEPEKEKKTITVTKKVKKDKKDRNSKLTVMLLPPSCFIKMCSNISHDILANTIKNNSIKNLHLLSSNADVCHWTRALCQKFRDPAHKSSCCPIFFDIV